MRVTSDSGRQRLLGNEPRAIVFGLFAFLLTVGVLALQTIERLGMFDVQRVPIFYRLFMFQDYPASFLFIAVVMLAFFPQVQRAGEALARALAARPIALSVLACAVLAGGALFVYHAHPLSMDEATPYMQSRIFASGALLGRFPPELVDWLVYPAFQGYFIHVSKQTGELVSAYWPGFALLLTPFTAAGVPWLCNPVLGALSILAIHRLTLALTGSAAAAGAAILFTVASPAFVINSISFYSMTAHLLCNAVFVLLLLNPSLTVGRAIAAGCVGGLALTLHNPVPHMLFALPWLVWLLVRKDRWRIVPAIAIGYLPWIAIAGFGWSQLIASLAVSGGSASDAATAGSLLGKAIATLSSVLSVPGDMLLWDREIALAKLWLWTAPAVALLAAVGFWRHRRDTRMQLLLASALLTFIGYLFVPLNQGHGWGFRYFHSAWFVLPVLAAVALAPAAGAAGLQSRACSLVRWTQGAALGGLLIMTPYFAWQVHAFIGSHLAQLPAAGHGRPRIVTIDPDGGYYAQDLVQNDPFLRDSLIRMVTHGREADQALMAKSFPDLVLLSSSARGSVWGYADAKGAKASADLSVGSHEQRQQK